MKDLRILEEQQRESQQKLQVARANKQRHLQAHAALETKLEDLKYKNGQRRVEIQRVHKLLSEQTRLLTRSRNEASSATDDLHSFDR
jgi:hypothetical protein